MENKPDDWLQSHWRPMVAVIYMIIILFDFFLAPILWSLLQYYAAGDVVLQWNPITLHNGGLFHAAIGAILGVSAFTRGQEKIQRLKVRGDQVLNPTIDQHQDSYEDRHKKQEKPYQSKDQVGKEKYVKRKRE